MSLGCAPVNRCDNAWVRGRRGMPTDVSYLTYGRARTINVRIRAVVGMAHVCPALTLAEVSTEACQCAMHAS